MVKTQRELAFLRDLYISDNWTSRFAELIDRHFSFSTDGENLLYMNAGTGRHAFALQERFGDRTEVFATCEDEETLNIAKDKAAIIRSGVDFSMARFDDETFDTVIGDASFVRPQALEDFFDEAVRVAAGGSNVGITTVTAGSFGEIFSLLWEVLFEEDLGEHGHAAEDMITEIPTTSRLEEIAVNAGLVNLKTHTSNEVFEYDNGAALVNSPLVADFLLPVWLRSLDEDDRRRVTDKLARLVDAEDGTLSFRFSVKATLVTGEKG